MRTMLVAMMYELREHDANGGLVLARDYHASGIVIRSEVDRAGPGQCGDRDEIVERAPLRLAHGPPQHFVGQQPDVELLATNDVLKGPVQRSVRAGRAKIKCRWLESTTELEQGLVRPRVVSQDVVESGSRHGPYVWRIGLPRLMNLPRPFFPRNSSFWTMTSPRESTTEAFPLTLRPSYGL